MVALLVGVLVVLGVVVLEAEELELESLELELELELLPPLHPPEAMMLW